MKLNMSFKLFAFSSYSLVLFAVNSANANVSINKVNMQKKSGEVSISTFKYNVAGKENECSGKTFQIASTKLKKMKMEIILKVPRYRDDIWVYMPNKLPARNIVDFELIDKSGKKLKEGTDYRLNIKGAVSQLKDKKSNTSNNPIITIATFSYYPNRYDSIFLDPKEESLSLMKGPVRDIDAEEYIPKTPQGKIRLCNIAVTGNKIQVIPTFQKKSLVVKGNLRAFYKKLKSGKKVKVLGYGDSITAMGTGRTYTPNSKNNDRYERFFFRFPKDTINLIEKYNFTDGVGKRHCKLGWNWKLVEEIEKKYGNKVEYLNCGIGGTRSDVTKNQGLYPDRIKAALDTKPDLVVLAFGMNELGSNRTEKNMDAIIKKFKAVGADVVVMGVPQINGTRIRIMDKWQKTNDNLRKVAIANNCPFIDTTRVNLGIAPEHICSANMYNHPGINELKKYGNALIEVLRQ